ncbi:DNA-binding protein [Pseudomonas viridiflava ICMP 13104]|uniref:DNA-binding protein n=1 Tax=Pseudomonas viridiflava ICMP 13104 TaxID=1198305 RepID=A0A0W0HLS6_PSEVI|nr:DNA-binding protein [Pseudomonas viridiflava ICMP 13104]
MSASVAGHTCLKTREAKGLTQEDFVGVSGRTYLSEIERGLKSPTLEKLDQLATRIGIHPLELLMSCYVKQASMSQERLLNLLNERSREA